MLFGLRARDQASADSDYDLAVFLKTMPDRWAERDCLADLTVRILDETGVFFDAKSYVASAMNTDSPLRDEVQREGRAF